MLTLMPQSFPWKNQSPSGLPYSQENGSPQSTWKMPTFMSPFTLRTKSSSDSRWANKFFNLEPRPLVWTQRLEIASDFTELVKEFKQLRSPYSFILHMYLDHYISRAVSRERSALQQQHLSDLVTNLQKLLVVLKFCRLKWVLTYKKIWQIFNKKMLTQKNCKWMHY